MIKIFDWLNQLINQQISVIGKNIPIFICDNSGGDDEMEKRMNVLKLIGQCYVVDLLVCYNIAIILVITVLATWDRSDSFIPTIV